MVTNTSGSSYTRILVLMVVISITNFIFIDVYGDDTVKRKVQNGESFEIEEEELDIKQTEFPTSTSTEELRQEDLEIYSSNSSYLDDEHRNQTSSHTENNNEDGDNHFVTDEQSITSSNYSDLPIESAQSPKTDSVSKPEEPAKVINDENKFLDVRLNSSIRLNCSFTGNPKPKVVWLFKNMEFPDGVIFNDGSLKLTNIQYDYTGSWRCEVSNKWGSDQSKSVMLRVIGPPSITKFSYTPNKDQVKKGTDVNFICAGYGPMPLTYHWYSNGRRLTKASNGRPIRKWQRRVTLKLNKTTSVKCILENDYGNDTRSMKMTVINKDGSILIDPTTTTTTMVTTTTR